MTVQIHFLNLGKRLLYAIIQSTNYFIIRCFLCAQCHSMHYGLEQVVVEAPGITPIAYTKLIPFLSNHHLDFLLVHCTTGKT